MSNNTLVDVRDIARDFDVSKPWLNRVIEKQPKVFLKAVDGVSFTINKGETLALVGESGCGKSTVARVICGLYTPTAGHIYFDGEDLANADVRNKHRKRFQMIFQDPYASLNPRWRVGKIIAEPILAHGLITDPVALKTRLDQLLTQVGLSPLDSEKFPHEFSGGQRQRISIARALSSNPEFLICDEPTSALDVSVQAQILNLMKDLQREFGLTYLFISHNLAVVSHISNRVGVMYLGRLVEIADTKKIFQRPLHPYTQMLQSAIPDLKMTGKARTPVAGEVPNPLNPPPGCTFHPRCPHANERCKTERPALIEQPDGGSVACHAVEEKRIAIKLAA
ncbi:MAG: ATP-binding cassette domain-containing protein [Betaproteobacteria bacterium]|nr:ATP-binding cassette domain-containing protein [Betaproteobacteria bacterium]